MSLFIDRRLRAFREPQKNNDSDEMAPLKSSSKFLLHFSFPLSPLSGHINIHTNEEHPTEQAMENVRWDTRTCLPTVASYTHCCSFLMGSNQMPCMFEVIYENWAPFACSGIA